MNEQEADFYRRRFILIKSVVENMVQVVNADVHEEEIEFSDVSFGDAWESEKEG